jgi:flagellar basal body rod protein FlgC
MSMTTDPAHRAAFIAGLRELADFLAANPAVAVSEQRVKIRVQPYGPDDESEEREVDAFAAAAGVSVLDQRNDAGHFSGRYSAARTFGPVLYEAFTYTAATMAEMHAQRSYEGNIQTGGASDEMGQAA